MKITILNASPRPKGNISTMLHTMEEELLANGAQVEFVDVSKLQVCPCIGCMKCRLTTVLAANTPQLVAGSVHNDFSVSLNLHLKA